jgi:hypothetical protein
MSESIPSLYRWHRKLGFGRWKALRRALWCWW